MFWRLSSYFFTVQNHVLEIYSKRKSERTLLVKFVSIGRKAYNIQIYYTWCHIFLSKCPLYSSFQLFSSHDVYANKIQYAIYNA